MNGDPSGNMNNFVGNHCTNFDLRMRGVFDSNKMKDGMVHAGDIGGRRVVRIICRTSKVRAIDNRCAGPKI